MNASGELTTSPPPFVFNKDYDDHEQVGYLVGEYDAVRADLAAAGRCSYDAAFCGKLPSLSTTDPKNEKAAIYLLQKRRQILEDRRSRDAFVTSGGVDATTIRPGDLRRGDLGWFGFCRGGTGWHLIEGARVTTDERGRVLFKLPRQRLWRLLSDAGEVLFRSA